MAKSKARKVADLISTGSPLDDGEITASDIADVTASSTELNILDGVTVHTSDINNVTGVNSAVQAALDLKGTVSTLSDLSVTATAAELNLLDGVPAGLTTTEIGYLDGVTASIQTQLDGKGTASSLTDLGVTVSSSDINTVVSSGGGVSTGKAIAMSIVFG